MSFSEQTIQKENINQRPRNNHFRNNRREWVQRGSTPATTTPITSVENSIQNENGSGSGYGGESVYRPVRPIVPNRNRTNFGSRGNPSRHVNPHREKFTSRGVENRNENNTKVPNDTNIPQLVQEIQEKLSKGSIECMICYDMVRRAAPIWSCSSCYSIFHLTCIKKWARAPTSVDSSVEKNHGFNWRCPGCQSVQLTASKEIRYLCFCGDQPDPPSDLYLTPHSCGEPCGKPLEKILPNSGVSKDDICPHVCVLQCHPGPCPPCRAFAPPRHCPCGKKVITTKCSDRKSGLTCGQRCDKLLNCARHHCEKLCHVGPCEPCQVAVDASCFCKKKNESILCGEMSVQGEIEGGNGVFSCESTCGKKLNCKNHICQEICHPGDCGECEFLPSKIKTCCCGKTTLNEERRSCLDAIPTCLLACDKKLPCGVHRCQNACHSGSCPPCPIPVTQKCSCGSTSRTVECHKTVDKYTCDKPCGRKKNCGRHRCSERCCPLSLPNQGRHLCSMPCEKKLRCGTHSCTSSCHSGHCPPCLETIFTDLTCACGRTSIPPPLPCGTPHPSCPHPCPIPQPCGHLPSHTCHFGQCPPCTLPVTKECVGGHVMLRNIPCGSKDIRCNKLCGKTRRCGLHACSRTCHLSPCDDDDGSTAGSRASCGQICGAPRSDCRHTCTATCHPHAACPDSRCEFRITISCSCGRITAPVPCDPDDVLEASIVQKLPVPLLPAGGTVRLGQRKLTCDDECARMERKKVLADAFDVTITSPNLNALHLGENEAISELLRRDSKWVFSVEERCKYLVLGRGRGGANVMKAHVFSLMSKEKREAVRVIAERWKLSVNTAGWEPKRFVIVHVTPKSKPPSRVLGVKSGNSSSILKPPIFDPTVDIDPRLVVALFDLPRDAGISALVLRFGGECELVWLNDKNALAVFSDPGRAAAAMRRLDQGSTYYGAVTVQQNVGGAGLTAGSGVGGAWGSGVGRVNNPWKKVDAGEGAFGNFADLGSPVWKENKAPIAGSSGSKWTDVLDSGSSSKSSEKVESFERFSENSSGAGIKQEEGGLNELCGDVVDDWETACD